MAGPTKKEIAEGYPVGVTLRFKNEDAKADFLSGLCDGWGENACSLKWSWPETSLHKADMIAVDVDPIE